MSFFDLKFKKLFLKLSMLAAAVGSVGAASIFGSNSSVSAMFEEQPLLSFNKPSQSFDFSAPPTGFTNTSTESGFTNTPTESGGALEPAGTVRLNPYRTKDGNNSVYPAGSLLAELKHLWESDAGASSFMARVGAFIAHLNDNADWIVKVSGRNSEAFEVYQKLRNYLISAYDRNYDPNVGSVDKANISNQIKDVSEQEFVHGDYSVVRKPILEFAIHKLGIDLIDLLAFLNELLKNENLFLEKQGNQYAFNVKDFYVKNSEKLEYLSELVSKIFSVALLDGDISGVVEALKKHNSDLIEVLRRMREKVTDTPTPADTPASTITSVTTVTPALTITSGEKTTSGEVTTDDEETTDDGLTYGNKVSFTPFRDILGDIDEQEEDEQGSSEDYDNVVAGSFDINKASQSQKIKNYFREGVKVPFFFTTLNFIKTMIKPLESAANSFSLSALGELKEFNDALSELRDRIEKGVVNVKNTDAVVSFINKCVRDQVLEFIEKLRENFILVKESVILCKQVKESLEEVKNEKGVRAKSLTKELKNELSELRAAQRVARSKLDFLTTMLNYFVPTYFGFMFNEDELVKFYDECIEKSTNYFKRYIKTKKPNLDSRRSIERKDKRKIRKQFVGKEGVISTVCFNETTKKGFKDTVDGYTPEELSLNYEYLVQNLFELSEFVAGKRKESESEEGKPVNKLKEFKSRVAPFVKLYEKFLKEKSDPTAKSLRSVLKKAAKYYNFTSGKFRERNAGASTDGKGKKR